MLDLFATDEQVTFESLSHQRTVIGLEALNVSQTLNAFTGRLPEFLDGAKQFIAGVLSPASPKPQLVDSRKLEHLMRDVDYVSAAPLRVFVPVGFNTTWLQYIELLAQAQKVLDDLQKGLLKPFETWIGTLLMRPDALRAVSFTPDLARYKAPDLDGLKQAFANSFDKSGKTESTYGAVIKRHGDLPMVTRNLNDVNGKYASINRKELLKQVTDISVLLDKLITNIKEDPETYQVSGPVLKQLTDLTYFMAREVEFYSTVGYFLQAFTTSVDDSYKNLTNILSK